MMLFVLVRDLDGEGEVVGWFSSAEDAVEAGKLLDCDWSIYVKEDKEKKK